MLGVHDLGREVGTGKYAKDVFSAAKQNIVDLMRYDSFARFLASDMFHPPAPTDKDVSDNAASALNLSNNEIRQLNETLNKL